MLAMPSPPSDLSTRNLPVRPFKVLILRSHVVPYGMGTSSLGAQYVTRIFHVPYSAFYVESGYGTLVVELGIVGLLLWLIMAFAIVSSAWKVVRKLKGTVWFPIGFVIFWYTGLVLFPYTFAGLASYEDFILNSLPWLSLGILLRLPSLAANVQANSPASLATPDARMT